MKIYLNPRKDENGKEKYDGFLHLRPLSWEEVKQCVENGEESIKINSKNNIIESCTITVSDGKNYHNSTGKIYNNLVLEGSFFQISKGTSYLKIVPGDEYIKSIPNISSPPTLTKLPIEVDLNYTYLYY